MLPPPSLYSKIDKLFAELQNLTPQDAKFKAKVKQLTANFDDFPDTPMGGSKGSKGSKITNRFIDWTFKRTASKPRTRKGLSAGIFGTTKGAAGCWLGCRLWFWCLMCICVHWLQMSLAMMQLRQEERVGALELAVLALARHQQQQQLQQQLQQHLHLHQQPQDLVHHEAL